MRALLDHALHQALVDARMHWSACAGRSEPDNQRLTLSITADRRDALRAAQTGHVATQQLDCIDIQNHATHPATLAMSNCNITAREIKIAQLDITDFLRAKAGVDEQR